MSIIEVSNLSKAYRIGTKANKADSFVGMLQDSVTAPFRNWRQMRQPTGKSCVPEDELHWALRDVSFEVPVGEVLGVIGRNGAGKSTLLKILSRITEPTSGEVRIRGRVASLLEVGTGFHPELTGRENVYLNGTILGMHKKEIDYKFDEIVEFSGVEKFLDTPIKRYSSGMKVRLAFAVAANLDPEILIIDEVLAVGDADFQKKCMGKMRDVADSGRTVLFVSHNLATLNSLCNTGLLLESGAISFTGSISACIKRYTSQLRSIENGEISLENHPNRRRNSETVLKSLRILGKNYQPSSIIKTEDGITIEFLIDPAHCGRPLHFGIGIDSVNYGRVCSLATYISSLEHPLKIPMGSIVRCTTGPLQLSPGRYSLSLSAGTTANKLLDAIDDACTIEVEPPFFLASRVASYNNMGSMAIDSIWQIRKNN